MLSSVQSSTHCFRGLDQTHQRELLAKMQRVTIKNCALRVVASAITFACVGCNRVILIPESSPIRLAEDCECHIFILTQDGEWRRSDNKVRIPTGFWCVPPSYVEGHD